MASFTEDAARVQPPQATNNNEAALVAATPSAEIDLFANEGPDVMAIWITLACDNPFNFEVGVTGVVGAPTSRSFFAGGSPVQFRAKRNTLRFLRVTSPLGGFYKWWNSGP